MARPHRSPPCAAELPRPPRQAAGRSPGRRRRPGRGTAALRPRPAAVAQARADRDALFQPGPHGADVALQPGEVPGREQRRRPRRRRTCRARFGEELVGPPAPLDQQPAQEPHPERAEQAQAERRVVLARSAQRGRRGRCLALRSAGAATTARSPPNRCGSASPQGPARPPRAALASGRVRPPRPIAPARTPAASPASRSVVRLLAPRAWTRLWSTSAERPRARRCPGPRRRRTPAPPPPACSRRQRRRAAEEHLLRRRKEVRGSRRSPRAGVRWRAGASRAPSVSSRSRCSSRRSIACGRKHLAAGGRELDRQRQPVQTAANLRHGLRVVARSGRTRV